MADKIEYEMSLQLYSAVNSFPTSLRVIFKLLYFEGLSVEQVSQRLGISKDLVKEKRKQAVQLLQERIKAL